MDAGRTPTATLGGVEIRRDVECVLRDRTVLRADVYRPLAHDASLPVLLLRSPYNKDMCHDGTYRHPAWYARQGFIVVIQDVRGRYASDGDWVPFVHEGADGFDTVEWAAGLDGANGRVGMYGASYPGLVQFLAAVEQPPQLAGIAPAVTSADLYAHWMYEGGALNLAFVAHWAAVLATADAVRRGDVALAARLRELTVDPASWLGSAAPAALEPLTEAAPYYREWLAHPTDDAYWSRLGAQARLDRLEVPVLHLAGWYDIFLDGGLSAFRQIAEAGRVEQELIVGPWAHYPWSVEVGQRRFPAAFGTGGIDDAQVSFFRRHLAAEPKPDPEPDARARVRFYSLFGDSWHRSETWPPKEAVTRSLYLHSEGAANSLGGSGILSDQAPGSGPPDFYQYYPAGPVPSLGGHSCCVPGLLPMGCADQTFVEQLPEVLVYTSSPLDDDLRLAGPVRAELYVSTDALAADYVARLTLVDDHGSWNIAEGITRLTALSDCEPTLVSISLRSVAATIRKGQRLRLAVTGGSFPTWDTNPQNGASPAETNAGAGRSAIHAVHHDTSHPSRLVVTAMPSPAS